MDLSRTQQERIWLKKAFHFLSFSFVIFLVLQSSVVEGYVRTRTGEGIPVFWDSFPIRYWVGKKGAKQFGGKAEIETVHRAFATWSGVGCADLRFQFEGLLENPSAGYDPAPNAQNRNVIYWVQKPEDWPFGGKVLAAATLFFQEKTGVIDDADIRLNDVTIQWALPEQKKKQTHDILNTLTHEIGHFLGLEHSAKPDSTMFEEALAEEQKKRDLHKDDLDGICTAYPRSSKLRFSLVEVDSDLRLTPCPQKTGKKPSEKKTISPSNCQLIQGFRSYDLTIFLLCLFLWASLGLLRKTKTGNWNGK